jgi:hypothetical protein
MDIGNFRNANVAVHECDSDQIRQSELRLDDLRGPALMRGAAKLLVYKRLRARHAYLGDLGDVEGRSELELITCGNCGIEHGMLRAAACIWLETELIAPEFPPQIFGELRRIITARLVEPEEAELAEEDVVCACETLACQQRGHHAAARGLSGLQALGEGAIYDALTVPGTLAERNSQRIHHPLHVQAQ